MLPAGPCEKALIWDWFFPINTVLQNYLCFSYFFLPSPVTYPGVQHTLPRQVKEWAGVDFFFLVLIQDIHSPVSGRNKCLCSLVCLKAIKNQISNQ